MTVDVEEWTSDFPTVVPEDDRLEKPLSRLLDLFDETGTKATLFFLLEPARRHVELLRRAVAAGHRIGLHGVDHRLVYSQAPDEFARAVLDGRRALEDLAGTSVTTYRAPCWSITRRSLWAFEALQRAGYEVDSSIFPTKNHLYGIPDAPRDPYRVRDRLVEFPPSVLRVGGVNIPFGGGFYLRALPLAVTSLLTRRALASGRSVLLYIHPWELDPDQPRNLPYRSAVPRFIHYFNLKTAGLKLGALLREFPQARALPETVEQAASIVSGERLSGDALPASA